jgi:hypothetical protein
MQRLLAAGGRRAAHELHRIDILICIDTRLRGQPEALCEEARSGPAHVQHAAARRNVRAVPHQMFRAVLIDDVYALHKATCILSIGVFPHAHAL